MTITVWEKLSDGDEAVEREFDLDPQITGEVETPREYCAWANASAGREIYFPTDPDESE